MTNLRRVAAIAGAAAILMAMVGCSAGVRAHSMAVVGPTTVATPTPVAVTPTPVAAPSPPPVPVSAACAGTPVGTKHIYVSIAQQHMWACDGATLLTESAVTTGASALKNVHDATPVGTFHIINKVRNTVLAGHDVNGSWNDHVAYWMPFSGGDGFHDSPWQTFPLGSPLYTTQGSHGCVHLPLDVIATLFAWTPVGTAVTIRA
ncbi:L,D-transpeptidase [Lacisediminihabitans sp.]|uniref:L,D-transpeptidase n=1 Tax=Lacisediminihabitans sp. TaxID=2787631 RepID=UPI00374CE9B1